MRKFYSRNLFDYIFNLGLMFLIFDVAIDFFRASINFGFLNNVPFSAIGFIICLISIPFLMVEWMRLPLGTHSKRINLYQGAGNLTALAVLVGGWIWREESFLYINSHLNELTTLTLSSSGLFLTILFGWLGGRLAAFISRKQINIEKLNFIRPKTATLKRQPDDSEKTPIGNLISNISATPARQN